MFFKDNQGVTRKGGEVKTVGRFRRGNRVYLISLAVGRGRRNREDDAGSPGAI